MKTKNLILPSGTRAAARLHTGDAADFGPGVTVRQFRRRERRAPLALIKSTQRLNPAFPGSAPAPGLAGRAPRPSLRAMLYAPGQEPFPAINAFRESAENGGHGGHAPISIPVFGLKILFLAGLLLAAGAGPLRAVYPAY